MNKKKSLSEIEKELEKLKEDKEKSELFLEINKKKFSEQLIKLNKEQIKNTVHLENKNTFTIWQRILRVLGIN